MADTIIIEDVEDGEANPQPAVFASTSSQHHDKKVSPLKAKLPVATHITVSPFATAKKQAHVLQAENQKLFAEFVEHCSPLTKDCPEVLTFLQSKHDKACSDYLSSVEFRNTLGRCLTRAQANHSKTFVYINELCTVLRQHTTKKRQTLAKAEPGCSTSLLDTTKTTSVTVKRKDKTKGTKDEEEEDTKSTAEEEKESGQKEDDDAEVDDEKEKKAKRASKKQIVHLENLLRAYNQEISRLQQAELSLDDMQAEDSLYIQEHKLKRKMMKIYKILCDLKGCNTLTGRVIEQRIPYSGTRYPEINKKIERFINSEEARSNPPDYPDILQKVVHANQRHNLCLNRKQLNQIAQEAFRETGSRMQERRHLDLVYNFGSTLTDSYKPSMDPALSDASLQRKLRSNREVALTHLEEVITKYAIKQDDTEEQERCRRQDNKDKEKSAKATENDKEEEDEEEEDEEDESSDPDVEEEIQACTQQNGADDDDEEDEDEEDDSNENEVESARGGTDKDEPNDDQTGSLSADEEESVNEEEEQAASEESQSLISPLSETPSSRESSSQPEGQQTGEPRPASNSRQAGVGEPADSSNHVTVVHVSSSQVNIGPADASPMAASEQPLPPSPSVIIEDCDAQTTNGTSPPPSPRITRTQKRKREDDLNSIPQKANHIILNDGDVEVLLDMGVYVCNSPHEVAMTRADSPSQDLVSSTQPAKKLKVSVGTQCDPEETIVLSD